MKPFAIPPQNKPSQKNSRYNWMSHDDRSLKQSSNSTSSDWPIRHVMPDIVLQSPRGGTDTTTAQRRPWSQRQS